MEQIKFYEQLKESLEKEKFKEKYLLMSKYGINIQKDFLIKSLYYLIGTRDFDGFSYFLDYLYQRIFPYDYLESQKRFTREQAQSVVYNNFFCNGFLFHITQKKNVSSIMEKGLQTLNDRYNCNFYEKSKEINNVYEVVRNRNTKKNNLFSVPFLIEVPASPLTIERFNTIYLSYNLEDTLKTYGTAGELSSLFITNLLLALKESGFNVVDKEDIKNRFIKKMKNNNVDIYDYEIKTILDYIDLVYDEIPNNSDVMKSIVLVPSVSVNDPFVKLVCSNEKMTLQQYETIINHNNGEVENTGSISSDLLACIVPQDDKTLIVKFNKPKR